MPNPILYLISGVGSGTLEGQNFTDASFVISVHADISQISVNTPLYPPGTHMAETNNGTSTISVAGLRSTILQFGMKIAVLHNIPQNTYKVSFGLLPDEFLGITNPGLHGYGLNNTKGPLAAVGPVTFSANSLPTTADGGLIFNAVSMAAFQAILLPTAAAHH